MTTTPHTPFTRRDGNRFHCSAVEATYDEEEDALPDGIDVDIKIQDFLASASPDEIPRLNEAHLRKYSSNLQRMIDAVHIESKRVIIDAIGPDGAAEQYVVPASDSPYVRNSIAANIVCWKTMQIMLTKYLEFMTLGRDAQNKRESAYHAAKTILDQLDVGASADVALKLVEDANWSVETRDIAAYAVALLVLFHRKLFLETNAQTGYFEETASSSKKLKQKRLAVSDWIEMMNDCVDIAKENMEDRIYCHPRVKIADRELALCLFSPSNFWSVDARDAGEIQEKDSLADEHDMMVEEEEYLPLHDEEQMAEEMQQHRESLPQQEREERAKRARKLVDALEKKTALKDNLSKIKYWNTFVDGAVTFYREWDFETSFTDDTEENRERWEARERFTRVELILDLQKEWPCLLRY